MVFSVKYLVLIGFSLALIPTPRAHAAASATVELKPAAAVVQVGETFSVSVSTKASEAVNAFQLYLQFPSNLLEVVSLDTTNSWATIWIPGSPSFENKAGTISLRGGRPTPGFTGEGSVGGVTLRAKAPGRASVTFTGDNKVLANDGVGTNVLDRTTGGIYVINPTPTRPGEPLPLVIFVPRPGGGPPIPVQVPREILFAILILSWLLLLLLLYYLWKRYREWRRRRKQGG